MFICNKCGSSDMMMTSQSTNTGLYCQSCGAWQKWLNKNEIKTAQFNKIPIFDNKPTKKETMEELGNLFSDPVFSEPLLSDPLPEEFNKVGPFDEIHKETKSYEETFTKTYDYEKTITIPLKLAEQIFKCMKDLEKHINEQK